MANVKDRSVVVDSHFVDAGMATDVNCDVYVDVVRSSGPSRQLAATYGHVVVVHATDVTQAMFGSPFRALPHFGNPPPRGERHSFVAMGVRQPLNFFRRREGNVVVDVFVDRAVTAHAKSVAAAFAGLVRRFPPSIAEVGVVVVVAPGAPVLCGASGQLLCAGPSFEAFAELAKWWIAVNSAPHEHSEHAAAALAAAALHARLHGREQTGESGCCVVASGAQLKLVRDSTNDATVEVARVQLTAPGLATCSFFRIAIDRGNHAVTLPASGCLAVQLACHIPLPAVGTALACSSSGPIETNLSTLPSTDQDVVRRLVVDAARVACPGSLWAVSDWCVRWPGSCAGTLAWRTSVF